jgi:hypothetical protein
LAEAVQALKSLKVGHANSLLGDTKRQVLHFLKTIANPANCKDYQTGSHQRLFDIPPGVLGTLSTAQDHLYELTVSRLEPGREITVPRTGGSNIASVFAGESKSRNDRKGSETPSTFRASRQCGGDRSLAFCGLRGSNGAAKNRRHSIPDCP